MTLLPPGFLHDFPGCPFRSTGTYLIPSTPQNSDSFPTRTFKKCKTIPKYYLSGRREDEERTGRVEVAPEEGWSPEEAAVCITVRGEAGGVGRQPANPASNCHSPSPAREDSREEDRRSQGKAGKRAPRTHKAGLGPRVSSKAGTHLTPRGRARSLAPSPSPPPGPSVSSSSSSFSPPLTAPAADLSAPLPAPLPALAAFPAARSSLLFSAGDGGWRKAGPPAPAARQVLGDWKVGVFWGSLQVTGALAEIRSG